LDIITKHDDFLLNLVVVDLEVLFYEVCY